MRFSLVLVFSAACAGSAPMAIAPRTSSPATAVETAAPSPTERPGLGTVWGEDVYAPVTDKPFERAQPTPWATAVIHYNDEEGVAAQARYAGGSLAPLELRPGDGAISIALASQGGEVLPGFSAGGDTLVVGRDGERYKLVVANATDARFEIVASVDGLDVIDGRPASPDRRGYLLEPRGTLTIDGFRQSDDRVAAFRFGRVSSSYAAQTSGDADVGVIGVAIFPEKGAVWTTDELSRRAAADPFPSRAYAAPP